MGVPDVSYGLKDVDGLTPFRALVLQAYYALRRACPADQIGTPEISAWIRAREPRVERPSGTLIRVTLLAAGVPHRGEGRPRGGMARTPTVASPPLPATPGFPRDVRPR